jgi:hypothetical protein
MEKKEEVNEVTAYMHRKYPKVLLDFFCDVRPRDKASAKAIL